MHLDAGAPLWIENGLFEKWKWTVARGDNWPKRHLLLLFGIQIWFSKFWGAPKLLLVEVWAGDNWPKSHLLQRCTILGSRSDFPSFRINCFWLYKTNFWGVFQRHLWQIIDCVSKVLCVLTIGALARAKYSGYWGLCSDLCSQSAMCSGD